MALAETVTFDFTKPDEITCDKAITLPDNGKGFTVSNFVFSSNEVTVSANKGTNNDAVIWNTNGAYTFRFYKGSVLTITAPSAITKITFGTGNNYFTPSNVTPDSGTLSGTSSAPVWTGSATTVKFTDGPNQNQVITTITVTYGEGETVDPEPTTPGGSDEVTFDFTSDSYGLPAYVDNNTKYVSNPSTITNGAVQVTFNSSTDNMTNSWRMWSDGLRAYKNGNPIFTVSVAGGGKVTNVTWTVANNGATFKVDGTNTNVTSWSGSEDEITFAYTSTSGNYAIKTLTVKYDGGKTPTVAIPTITCEDNTVTISCATDDAKIYYTIDGTDPTTASNLYTQPFEITKTVTVKAIAELNGDLSSVAQFTANFVGTFDSFNELITANPNGGKGVVNGPITVVYQNGQYLYVVDSKNYPMLIFGSTTNTYANGDQIASIEGTYSPYMNLPEITNPIFGAKLDSTKAIEPTILELNEVADATYNSFIKVENVTVTSAPAITDGNTTVALYKRFNNVDLPTNLAAKYDVVGFVSVFNTTLQIYFTEFIEIVEENQVEQPVITPNGGAVDPETEVEITCDTPGATIYYTTNGEEPTADDNEYTAPIVITEAVTIKAIAVKAGMLDSYVTTATFTVNDPNAKEATFDFTDVDSLGLGDVTFTDNDAYNLEVGATITSNAATITFTAAGSTANRLWNSSGNVDLRLYTGAAFTVSVDASKYHLTSIDFTKAGGNFAMTPNHGTLTKSGSSATWIPTSGDVTPTADGTEAYSDVTFTMDGTTRISTITVNYAVGEGTSQVENVVADQDAVVEYYNLQGVRVAEPQNGLYIRRQGNTATKVLVK